MRITSSASRSNTCRASWCAAPLAASTTMRNVAGASTDALDGDVIDVGRLERLVDRTDAARLAVGRLQRIEFTLDRRLDLVGQLRAAGREELDAVVVERVVRRRDHRPHRTELLGDEGDHRRRHHTEPDDVDAFSGEAGAERGVEHRCGDAGVATDHDGRRGPVVGPIDVQHPGRGAAQAECEFCGQFGVRDTTDAVGTELHDVT